MLNKVKELNGYKLHCLDGELGKVKEFYFDDKFWTIRYLIADTGNWLNGRQVLISPHALSAVNTEERYSTINLTKRQIECSPPLDNDKAVSRQFEESYYAYYGYPTYFSGPYVWGANPFVLPYQKAPAEIAPSDNELVPNLRSTKAISGYGIHATDGEIGHVDDFIIDDETWAIRYLVIDTQNWWPGKKVLVSPNWISNISWEKSKVSIKLPRESIKLSPEYTDESELTRNYVNGLHMYYNRRGYWINEHPRKVT